MNHVVNFGCSDFTHLFLSILIFCSYTHKLCNKESNVRIWTFQNHIIYVLSCLFVTYSDIWNSIHLSSCIPIWLVNILRSSLVLVMFPHYSRWFQMFIKGYKIFNLYKCATKQSWPVATAFFMPFLLFTSHELSITFYILYTRAILAA